MQGASAELRPVTRGSRARFLLRVRAGSEQHFLGGRADMLGGVLAVIGALVAAGFSLQLWNAHLHVPFHYGWDAIQVQMYIKSVINGGWIWHVHGIGAPFGGELFDYPQGTDSLNYLMIKVIGFAFDNSAKTMNLFFLLTFATDALAAYIVMRWLGLSIAASVVCAILFSDSPYHLFRGELHLLLSSYPSVPMGAYLMFSVFDGKRLFARGDRSAGGIRRWMNRRNVFTLVICVMIGSLGIYYAIFTALLMVPVMVASAFGRRSWTPIVHGIAVVALIGITTLANDIPAALYRGAHGVDPAAVARVPEESELYALKLTDMVLPVPGHRIAALSRARERYDSESPVPSEEAQQSLGAVSTIALAWLFVLALATVAGIGRAAPALRRHRQIAFLTLCAFLLGTVSGISALIGNLATTQIRAYDRISIVIAFFCIATVGLGIDALRARLGPRRREWWLASLALVLLVGVYDQSSYEVIPPYEANGVAFATDGQFTARIEHILPPRSSIFELPYVPFPENPPVNRMIDYDEGRGFVHSDDLSWSYGAMKGRPEDWAGQTQSLPVPVLVDGVVAAGFSGIWVDTYGYFDGGQAIDESLKAVLGAAPIVSRDGRFQFFDLRSFAARLRAQRSAAVLAALRQSILHPVEVDLDGQGFYADESGSRWAVPDASALMVNPGTISRRMLFAASVFTLARGRHQLTIKTPDGQRRTFAIGHRPRRIEMYFDEPPGSHGITFDSNAPIVHDPPDPRALAVRYNNIALDGAGLAPFL